MEMAGDRIHTTLNLSCSDATTLNEKSKALRLKRSELVVLIMRKMLTNSKRMRKTFETVKYQEDVNYEGWRCVHVFLEKGDYEVFIDMRKFFKWSVSALVAMALKRYMNEISVVGKSNFQSFIDNYKMISYECDCELNNNIFCWHINWILGEKFAQKFV